MGRDPHAIGEGLALTAGRELRERRRAPRARGAQPSALWESGSDGPIIDGAATLVFHPPAVGLAMVVVHNLAYALTGTEPGTTAGFGVDVVSSNGVHAPVTASGTTAAAFVFGFGEIDDTTTIPCQCDFSNGAIAGTYQVQMWLVPLAATDVRFFGA